MLFKSKHKSLVFLVLMVLLGVFVTGFIGCAEYKTSKFCANIPPDNYSVLCQVSAEVGTTLETVGTIVKVADLLLLNETHTANEAYEFFSALEEASRRAQELEGTTYQELIDYCVTQYSDLPPKVRAAITIVEDFYNVEISGSIPSVLSGYDWYIIDTMLAEQKQTIEPFLLE
jgi:hypothetical protein